MAGKKIVSMPLKDFALWRKTSSKTTLLDFELELTARCNNNCRHCYINLPAHDAKAAKKELSLREISKLADEAVSLGALSCLLTGGEPLLRKDFSDIYLALKKKGLLLSVFTNAALINEKHIKLFKQYPPREIEVSVYGVTQATYERVTRKPGSFEAFMRGVNMLMENGIKVRFKAMAMRSNLKEMPLIAKFCRERTKDYFRFDPLLHLRFDRDEKRNAEIREERLSPDEVVKLEKQDPERFKAMLKDCRDFTTPNASRTNSPLLFRCGAGRGSCSISYDGIFRLCSSLWHPGCIYDLKRGTLADAYNRFVPEVRKMTTANKNFLENCGRCEVINFCLWCPAHSYLETGKIDEPVESFCKTAKAREKMLKSGNSR